MSWRIDTELMTADNPSVLARLTSERRDGDRREAAAEPTLSALLVFDRSERDLWRRLDRRKLLRRHVDVRRRVARQ